MSNPKKLNVANSFPLCVEFQTTSLCNAQCSCCPHHEVSQETPCGYMSDDLIQKIISECSEHKEEMDLIIPYLNNEPFIDKRMIEILRLIKKHIHVDVEISTNISHLSSEKAKIIVQENLINTLRISMFGMNKETYERRMRGLRWERFSQNINNLVFERNSANSNMAIEIIMISQDGLSNEEVASARQEFEANGLIVRLFGYLDRAGNNLVKNLIPLTQLHSRISACELNRPFERLVIRHDGTCVLCSQDWRGEVILGDINNDSISKIWNSETTRKIREIVSGGCDTPLNFICRKCKLAIME
ncbi:radical SAM protein [Pseudomonas frederiksbergensis]|uniref:radical SAM/SPASM domain-containing protein n=1 Tax=Pseudomonas frederiksbergensis TaxID=104087 RepID=UPI00197F1460|nr:radical SAM/SPASM domain-containing protein [Pseudomonas frederiksbergensis]MBN3865705.1 radical SAM protein [Pseudomonas frederiksbergensis]